MAIVAAGILVAFITVLVLLSKTALKIAIYGFLYEIAKALFAMCDFLQLCFRRLAGLDTYWFKETASSSASSDDGKTGDILLSIFSSKTVVEALIAMTLFAVALLLIVTIVQIIRVEYTTEGSKNSKGTILGKAIKSFAMFILIPVVCFLGIFASNKILFALDAATAQAGSSTLAGSIFLAGASDANVVRMGGTEEGVIDGLLVCKNEKYKAQLTDNSDGLVGLDPSIFKSSKSDTESKQNEIATTIDNIFVRKYNRFYESKTEKNAYTVGQLKDKDSNAMSGLLYSDDTYVHYSVYRTVQYFYDFSKMNFFIFYVGTFFVLMSLIKASVGLIMRLYKGTALFIISPAVTALTPLDDGNAYKSWRKAFIGCVLGAYGYVVALNLLFLIMGVVDNIYLFPNSFGFYTANKMVQCLMVIVGVNMLSDLSGLVSGFIGAEDVLKTGEGMSKKVMETTGKVGKMTVQGGMAAAGMFGSVAGRIASKNAVKSQTLQGNVNTAKSQLDKAIASGDTEAIRKARNKVNASEAALNKYNAKGDVKEREQRARTRAAVYTRAAVRGRETASSMFQDSAIGSFLNTATGKMFESFGGKGLKNLDEKLKPNKAAYDIAGKVPTVGDVLGKGAAFAYNLGKDPGKEFIDSNKEYSEYAEKNKIFHDEKVADYYMTETQQYTPRQQDFIHATQQKEQRTQSLADFMNNFDEIKAALASGTNTDAEGVNIIKGMVQSLSSSGLNTQSQQLINNLQSSVANTSDYNTISGAISSFQVGNMKIETPTDLQGKAYDFDSLEAKGLTARQFATDYDNRVKEQGLGYVKSAEEAWKAYDAALKAAANANNTNGSGNNNSGQAGQGGTPGGKDTTINLTNADVKIQNSNTEVDGKTEIKDANAIAQQIKSATNVINNNAAKKAKEAKDNEIINMLKTMQKTLGDIKKNTKK